MAMNEEKEKRVCLKCGRSFEQKDPLPLCPECLFGIEDLSGVHKAKYPSAMPRNHGPDKRGINDPSGR